MDTLPISTLPTPAAPSGAECAADAADPANASPEGGFQAVLSRSLAGGAQDATDTGAAAQDAAREELDATADAALAAVAEGVMSASDSALALLAALPQQATETVSSGANTGSGIGDVMMTKIASPTSDSAGGDSATIAARRADDPAAPGKGMAALRPGDAAQLSAFDPEKIGETARAGVGPVADLNTAGTQQAAHAAYVHTSLVAPDSAASTPAPIAQPRIDTPLGAPGWSTALADQLVMFAGEKQQIAELRINPPHLGPVDITLTVSDDQASAVFASPHAIVRETIESALPRLREVLAESGINLGQASVTADSPRDGSAQAQLRSSFARGGERSGAEVTHPMAATRPVGRALPGLVDLFA
jgi:flagellar hook-length control protein FliK